MDTLLGLMFTLILASAIGYTLKWKVGFSTPHAVIDNLNARINAWWVMILIIFAAAFIGFYAVIALFFIISFMALREFLSLIYIRRGDHLALAACFYVILPYNIILWQSTGLACLQSLFRCMPSYFYRFCLPC